MLAFVLFGFTFDSLASLDECEILDEAARHPVCTCSAHYLELHESAVDLVAGPGALDEEGPDLGDEHRIAARSGRQGRGEDRHEGDARADGARRADNGLEDGVRLEPRTLLVPPRLFV